MEVPSSSGQATPLLRCDLGPGFKTLISCPSCTSMSGFEELHECQYDYVSEGWEAEAYGKWCQPLAQLIIRNEISRRFCFLLLLLGGLCRLQRLR